MASFAKHHSGNIGLNAFHEDERALPKNTVAVWCPLQATFPSPCIPNGQRQL